MQSEGAKQKTVVSSASADTDGAYVELIASTGFRARWCVIAIRGVVAAGTRQALFGISTGAAGVEVDNILDDTQYFIHQTGLRECSWRSYAFPIDVAASTRIAARIQDATASTANYAFRITLTDIAPPIATPTAAEFAPAGTFLSPATGGSDAYGAWLEAFASLTRDAKWASINVNIGKADQVMSISVGTGPGASESEEIVDIGGHHIGNEVYNSGTTFIPVDFSSGDRISVRARDDTGGADAVAVSIVLYG